MDKLVIKSKEHQQELSGIGARESEVDIKIGEAECFLGDGALVVEIGQLRKTLSGFQRGLIHQRIIGGFGGRGSVGRGRRRFGLARLPESESGEYNQKENHERCDSLSF